MVDVIWRNEVLGQRDQIITYIDQFDPDAAQRIGQRLIEPGESLAIFPNRGRPPVSGMREMVTVAPDVLSYQVEKNAVTIVSIRHGARRG